MHATESRATAMNIPTGMTRRHFLNHALTSAAAVPALEFLLHLEANAATVRKNQKACILLWLGGGPPTIDMWDLKPGSKNGGEFKPIATSGSVSGLRAHAQDRQNRLEALDRPLDEHPRGRPRTRAVLPAHVLRAEPDGDSSVVRFGRQPRAGTQAAVARNPRFHFDRRRAAKGRAFWGWPTPPSSSMRGGRYPQCRDRQARRRTLPPSDGDARRRRDGLHQFQAGRRSAGPQGDLQKGRQPDDVAGRWPPFASRTNGPRSSPPTAATISAAAS